MAAKTTCPITHRQFKSDAKDLQITIDGQPFTAKVKEFSTGSLGWYLNGKATVKVGETPVTVQIGLNLTILGSKDVAKDAAPAAASPQSEAPPVTSEGSPDV